MAPMRRGVAPLDRSGETWNLLYRLAQHWHVAAALGLCFAAGGVLYARSYSPVYHADAQVRVGDNLDAKSVPGQREDSTDMVDLPENLAASFRARFMVDPKLQEMLRELGQDPTLGSVTQLRTERGRDELVESIKAHVQVDPITRRVFRVSYDGQNPAFVQRVVQRLSELGVEDVIDQRSATARQARQFLDAEVEASRKRMVDAEDDLVRFIRQHPSLRVNSEKKAGMSVGDKLLASRAVTPSVSPLREHEMATMSAEVRALLQRKADLEATASQIEAAQKLDPVQTKLSELERLQQQLSELKAQNYTQEYPEFRRITGEIERLQNEIRDSKNRKDRVLAQDMRRMTETRAEIAAVDRQIAIARKRASGESRPLPPGVEEGALSAEATYARLVRDTETLRGAYDKLHDREVEAQINEELSKVKGNLAARIEEPAKRPTSPRGVSQKMMTFLCMLLGMGAGLLIAVVRSLTDPHIYTVYDLARASKLPVLGRIPRRDGQSGTALSDVSEEVTDSPSGNQAPVALLPEASMRSSANGVGAIERDRSAVGIAPVQGPLSGPVTGPINGPLSLPHPSSQMTTGVHPVVQPMGAQQGHGANPAMSTGVQAAVAAQAATGTHPAVGDGARAGGGAQEWGNDYMVVYSSGREATYPGARTGNERAVEDNQMMEWDGKVAGPMSMASSSRRSALHMVSPQSVGFRLTGMGHALQTGTLPQDPHLFLVVAPDGARAEQYRLVRCRLQDVGDPRVIVLTSALRGEGKTIAAANLALAYAEGGAHSVVLIDAHLAVPRLTEMLGAQPRTEPLSEADVLKGGLQIWQYAPNLFLMPSLGPRVKRSAVLSSPAFAMLVQDLRQVFDYIIIDAPAVASAADTKILLRGADVGLFLTKARSTTGKAVEVALDRLGRRSIAGVVLNEFGR